MSPGSDVSPALVAFADEAIADLNTEANKLIGLITAGLNVGERVSERRTVVIAHFLSMLVREYEPETIAGIAVVALTRLAETSGR